MKFAYIMMTVGLLQIPSSFIAHAAESVGEKIQVGAKNTKRLIKKGANRVGEAVCLQGDLECTTKKAKNRLSETKDSTVDAAVELKNKVD